MTLIEWNSKSIPAALERQRSMLEALHSLEDHPDGELPPYLEELFSVRLMRHLYAFKDDTSFEEYDSGLKSGKGRQSVVRMYVGQLLLTTEALLEPRREHPDAVAKPSAQRLSANYMPPPDGIDANTLKTHTPDAETSQRMTLKRHHKRVQKRSG